MTVCALPPSVSFSSHVSTESRYGTWVLPAGDAALLLPSDTDYRASHAPCLRPSQLPGACLRGGSGGGGFRQLTICRGSGAVMTLPRAVSDLFTADASRKRSVPPLPPLHPCRPRHPCHSCHLRTSTGASNTRATAAGVRRARTPSISVPACRSAHCRQGPPGTRESADPLQTRPSKPATLRSDPARKIAWERLERALSAWDAVAREQRRVAPAGAVRPRPNSVLRQALDEWTEPSIFAHSQAICRAVHRPRPTRARATTSTAANRGAGRARTRTRYRLGLRCTALAQRCAPPIVIVAVCE